MTETKLVKMQIPEKKVTIDRIILYVEPIQERHNTDAFILFKKKTIKPRVNYRAVVLVREKLPSNRHYYTLSFEPGKFNLNPGDIVNHSLLIELEDAHRQKVKRWVETSNSRFIITEPNCDCQHVNTKIHTFSLKEAS